ncbi:hypothetical protein [Nocardia sp. XZ_19_385]|uniref:hypothetical protein n=1 Tax=Nocardia sp. XZ_19_385 TaxID=2769488 RepID=UPI001E316055|nr:hypothetical protein [Nocardia sp. XZ_19_385]
MKPSALQAIPVLGWIYLIGGLLAALAGRAPKNRALRAIWWIDAFLSIVVHAAQIAAALRATNGRDPLKTAVLTQIFGLTYWRTQDLVTDCETCCGSEATEFTPVIPANAGPIAVTPADAGPTPVTPANAGPTPVIPANAGIHASPLDDTAGVSHGARLEDGRIPDDEGIQRSSDGDLR